MKATALHEPVAPADGGPVQVEQALSVMSGSPSIGPSLLTDCSRDLCRMADPCRPPAALRAMPSLVSCSGLDRLLMKVGPTAMQHRHVA